MVAAAATHNLGPANTIAILAQTGNGNGHQPRHSVCARSEPVGARTSIVPSVQRSLGTFGESLSAFAMSFASP
jgi:hypothetical protein